MVNSAPIGALLFLGGACSTLLFDRLPPDVLLPVVFAAAMLLLLCRRLRGAGVFLLGFAALWLDASLVIGQRLEPSLVGQDQRAPFRIDGFPAVRSGTVRLIVSPVGKTPLPRRIRLSWFEAPVVPQIGECWHLTVRLRRPRGWSNPGSFDYEGWLFRQGIGATGYVRTGEPVLDCAPAGVTTRLRRRLADRISALLPADDATAVLRAITVGAREQISREQWRRYAITGTSHLMAISGMHIALAFAGSYLVARAVLAAIRRHGNYRDHAAVAALVVAVLYAALSGFAVPARRALTMLVLAVAGVLLRRPLGPGRLLGLTCLVIAGTSPRDVLTPGFQLSFGAVAVLLVIAQRAPVTTGARWALVTRLGIAVRELGALQLALLFGLFPLTVGLFGRTAWIAPAVNLLVLPIFNLVAVPAGLGGLIFGGPLAVIGDGLLRIAWHGIGLILWVVSLASRIPGVETEIAALDAIALVVAWTAVLWIALPAGWPGRRLAWLAAGATLLQQPSRPPAGCADIHTLDVGQGLATVITTEHRTVVFDTGPAFRTGTDSGRLVVAPFLRASGITAVDLLVVSHADQDHSGGAASISGEFEVRAILAGEPLPSLAARQHACRAGQTWSWDAARFAVLQPGDGERRSGNNASCVLEIRVGDRRALLTGDIEKPVERRLVAAGLIEGVDLVAIPHHGSGTSSHREFVAALSPAIAIASTGFGNRWGMPKPDVVERWQATGSLVLDTATSGAVSVRLCADSGLTVRHRHRRDARRFWHED